MYKYDVKQDQGCGSALTVVTAHGNVALLWSELCPNKRPPAQFYLSLEFLLILIHCYSPPHIEQIRPLVQWSLTPLL